MGAFAMIVTASGGGWRMGDSEDDGEMMENGAVEMNEANVSGVKENGHSRSGRVGVFENASS